jgi:hypothetical protein
MRAQLRVIRAALALVLCAALAGRSGWPSSLNPDGPNAEGIAKLFWSFAVVCGIAWVVIILALVWFFRGRAASAQNLDPLALGAVGPADIGAFRGPQFRRRTLSISTDAWKRRVLTASYGLKLSACSKCAWNNLTPLSRSDFSSEFCASGIRVVFRALITVL